MRRTKRAYITVRILPAVMACAAFSGAALAAEGTALNDDNYEMRLLDACINTICKQHVARVLRAGGGELLASRETLTAWGLVTPDVSPIRHNAQNYYPVGALSNVEYEIDEPRQKLMLDTDTAANFLPARNTTRTAAFTPPSSPTPGGFINYDVLHQATEAGDTTGAALDLGMFNRLGTGTTTLLARELGSNTRFLRLNTTWRRDWPGRVRTLSLGDTISRPGRWGRAVQFGGIQWGTNFDTRPDFVTFPLPRVNGEATVPSSVELYANDRKRHREQVQPGPFTLENIPVATGANDLRIVVQDVLGRERVINRSFYVSDSLLKKGLHDFTYEAGAIRRGFAIRSNDYGRGFGAGTHRLGITDNLTGEIHGEILEDQATAGLSASWLAVPWLGVLSGSLAGSTGKAGQGSLASIGLNRQGRRLSYGFRTTWASPRFQQLGLQPDEPAPERILSAHLGARVGGGGSLSLNFSELKRRAGNDSRFVRAGFSTRLLGDVSLHTSLLRDLENRNSVVSVNLSIPLGRRRSANVSHFREDAGSGTSLQVQKNPPRGTGLGYRVSTERNGNGRDRRRAEVLARTGFGTYRAETARVGDDTSYRLNARGGVALLGGRAFVSRRIDDGFGVIRIGEYPDVRVYHENQLIDRTDAGGAAFIPDMRAFDKNRIRIAAGDLPLDASIGKLDTVAVPGYRQGVLVDFEVKTSQGALITILRENGQPLPAGATVRIAGERESFPVARRGQAWVTGLKPVTALEARWNGRTCEFEIALPSDAGPLPRIGPVTCEGTL